MATSVWGGDVTASLIGARESWSVVFSAVSTASCFLAVVPMVNVPSRQHLVSPRERHRPLFSIKAT
jgi:hypothetical protein